MKLILGFFSVLLLTVKLASAADYEGTNVDKTTFKGTIYSHETKQYYDVELQFDTDKVVVQFASGAKKILVLDDETIKYVQNIPASDYLSGKYYVLSLTFNDSDDSDDKLPSETL
ncbi:MAG: hypothetical protein ACHQYP_10985 [Nitrospiria bacterium]